MKIHDVAILKNEFAIILSKKPVYIRPNPVMCACVYVCSGGKAVWLGVLEERAVMSVKLLNCRRVVRRVECIST